MKRISAIVLSCFVFFAFCAAGNHHNLRIITTGDVHGAWFPESYVNPGELNTSLMSVKHFVDSIRADVGRNNVLLLDAGDCLQGDNATYYFNNVVADRPHLFPRLVAYMGYDALVVGNHDIEAGHKVYDKVYRELAGYGIPWLGGNAVKDDGTTYFPEYAVFRKAGLKVLVIGFTNANIGAWVADEEWKGMTFQPIVSRAQAVVDRLTVKENPQIVVMVVHSGIGDGDGRQLENEGLDLFRALKGVDLLVCGHDHRSYVIDENKADLVDGGAKAGRVGVASVDVETRGRKLVSKTTRSEVVRLDKKVYDEEMEKRFRPEFEEVRAFTLRPVGNLEMELRTRDAYVGMSDYVNLLHRVQMNRPGVQLSLAAPLKYDSKVEAGQLVFNDMFTIYPYENQLVVAKLSGSEIVRILEFSYDRWIGGGDGHVLKIRNTPDERTGSDKWSFVGRPYNFDSVAGLIYTVDVTKPFGSRICIKSMADGSAFDEEAFYNVAMTSYRANGGGGIIPRGAGLDDAVMASRIVGKDKEIRMIVYDFFLEHPVVDSALVNDEKILGHWEFIPADVAGEALRKDMNLLFGDR